MKLKVDELLSTERMTVGKILDMNDFSHESLTACEDILFGKMFDHDELAVHSPMVMLCTQEMSALIKRHRPFIPAVSLNDIQNFLNSGVGVDMMCLTTDEKGFPSHYIVITSLYQLMDFISGGQQPVSGLIAVKGFVASNERIIMVKHVTANDIIHQVDLNEFDNGKHDAVMSLTLHGDGLLLSFIGSGWANKRDDRWLFLDKVPINMAYDPNKQFDASLRFKSGFTVIFSTKEEKELLSKDSVEEHVVNGRFGR